jgi:hypothetical protein
MGRTAGLSYQPPAPVNMPIPQSRLFSLPRSFEARQARDRFERSQMPGERGGRRSPDTSQCQGVGKERGERQDRHSLPTPENARGRTGARAGVLYAGRGMYLQSSLPFACIVLVGGGPGWFFGEGCTTLFRYRLTVSSLPRVIWHPLNTLKWPACLPNLTISLTPIGLLFPLCPNPSLVKLPT